MLPSCTLGLYFALYFIFSSHFTQHILPKWSLHLIAYMVIALCPIAHQKKLTISMQPDVSLLKGLSKRTLTFLGNGPPSEESIDYLFGFPTHDNKFSIDISRSLSDIFGEFLLGLEIKNKQKCIKNKKNFGSFFPSNINNFKKMKGHHALVLCPGELFTNDQERYCYVKCSGVEEEPLGFYFKWLEWSGDIQNDPKIYLAK